MTNKKSTKKALLMSALSLLLCCSMLIGTTFAWFTDEVKSGVNKITAGNLDVEVYYGKDAEPEEKEENKVTGATKLFTDAAGKDILWEPGVVAYTNLKVVNEGTLELKYQFAMNFENENYILGTDAKLSEVLKVAFLDDPVSGTREQILAAAKAAGGVKLKNLMKVGNLAAGENMVYGVVIYWEPSNLDNTWNVFNGRETNDKKPLHIDLGLKLVATQKDAEQDSFGSDYDEYAGLPWDGETVTPPVADANGVIHITNAAELVAMMDVTGNSIYSGKTIVLDADIDLNGNIVKGIGGGSNFAGTFDGQGHTISNFTVDASDRSYYAGLFNQVSHGGTVKNLTVKNATVIGKSMVGAIASSVDSNAVIDNCKAIDCTLIGVKKVGAVVGYTAGSTVTNNYAENCTVYYSEKEGGAVLGYENTGSTVSNNTYKNVTVKQATVICTAADLQAALDAATDGTTIYMAADINGDVTITRKDNVNVVLDGNNHKLTGMITLEGNTNTGSLTIQNINFVATPGAESAIYAPGKYDVNGVQQNNYVKHVTVDNCTFTEPADDEVDCAAIRAASGGKKYWTIKNCTVDNTMHSFMQVDNIEESLVIDNCKVYSKNGANLNSCCNVTITNSVFDVKGYAVRFGVKTGGNLGTPKNQVIENSTLKSACDDGDAVIMFRASAVDAVLTLTNTKVEGATAFKGNTAATTITIDGVALKSASSQSELNSAVASGNANVTLTDGSYTMPGTSGNVTISGTKDTVVDLGKAGADNVTFNGVTVKTTGYYGGLIDSDTIVYNKCTIDGPIYLYGEKVVFNECTFDFEDNNDYLWVYAAKNVEFNDCTFNTMGKAILVFQDGSSVAQTVKVEGCTFNATQAAYNWNHTLHISAVSIDGSQGGSYNVILNNNTVDSDFNGLWQDKTNAGNITVSVDGATVLNP